MNSTVHQYNNVHKLCEVKIERRAMGGNNDEDDEYGYDSDGDFDEL